MSAYVVNASFWFLILWGLYAFGCILRDAIKRKRFDSDACTRSDERCIRTRLKQEDARRKMKRLGIQTLLDGREHVPATNHIAPARKPTVTVVPMFKGRK